MDSTTLEPLINTSIFLVLGAFPNAVIFSRGSGPLEETNRLLYCSTSGEFDAMLLLVHPSPLSYDEEYT